MLYRIFPGGRLSDLVQALDYCMEQGIDVANMSLGGGEPSKSSKNVSYGPSKWAWPASSRPGIPRDQYSFRHRRRTALRSPPWENAGEFPQESFHSQQALDGFQSRDGYFPAKFSCFGPEIDVCAPGVAIVSSLPADGFGAWDGTSMATPHVTGLAALVLAHHPDFKGGAFQNRDARRVERLFQILKETATPLQFGDPTRSGAGLPDAPRALGLEAGIAAPGMDASLDALRRLLGMIRGGPQPSVPVGAMAPQSIDPMQGGGSGPAVVRGPAQTSSTTVDPAFVPPTAAQMRELLRKFPMLGSAVPRGPAQTASTTVDPASADPSPAQLRAILHNAGLL